MSEDLHSKDDVVHSSVVKLQRRMWLTLLKLAAQQTFRSLTTTGRETDARPLRRQAEMRGRTSQKTNGGRTSEERAQRQGHTRTRRASPVTRSADAEILFGQRGNNIWLYADEGQSRRPTKPPRNNRGGNDTRKMQIHDPPVTLDRCGATTKQARKGNQKKARSLWLAGTELPSAYYGLDSATMREQERKEGGRLGKDEARNPIAIGQNHSGALAGPRRMKADDAKAVARGSGKQK
ncbi:hypothetical protein B0O99DRAFT_599358 [Bisporella sp. PMI_857]|nr:hypothetical protein B0O99DRAFT_599358 [Bisporella sp. PMI_857]